jgi:hypothetical protein
VLELELELELGLGLELELERVCMWCGGERRRVPREDEARERKFRGIKTGG